MTFEGQYLTYLEYKTLGGTLNEMPFNLLEFEARKQIDLRTHKRLVEIDDIPNEVKLCVYNLINTIEAYSNEINRNISSETVGSYSVNYKDDVSNIVKNKSTEIDDIILHDLYGLIVNNEHVIYNG